MHSETNASQALFAGKVSEQVGYTEAREAFQRNSNWWTVFACFDLPDFRPSALWLSTKTGIHVEEVVEALEGLIALGYLKKENGLFEPVRGKEFLNFDWSSKTKAEIINEHTEVSQQILNQAHAKTTVAFDHRFIPGNMDTINELYKDIKAAFDKAFAEGQKNKSAINAIFKITFTGVDVLNGNDISQGEQ